MPNTEDHYEMKRVLEENNRLIDENNKLLKKIHRNAKIAFWMRVTWYVLLIGLPFALYFYVLEPYFTLLGSSYQEFSEGIAEIPGWKQLNLMIESVGDGSSLGDEVQTDGFQPVE